MSVNYGNPGGYIPPRKVNFGWIGESFNLFQQNVGVWIVGVLAVFFIPFIFSMIVIFAAQAAGVYHPAAPPPPGTPPSAIIFRSFSQSFSGLQLGLQVLQYLFQAFLFAGFYQMANKTVRGEAIAYGDIFSGGARFLPMAGFMILFGLITGLGTLLLIIPGVILGGMLFPGNALVADGESPVTALSRSFEAMKSDWASAAGFYFVMGLLMLAGVLLCGLGTLVTYPMFFIVSALAYRDMIGMPVGAVAAPNYGVPQAGTWPPPPTVSSSPFAQTPPAMPTDVSPTMPGMTPPPAAPTQNPFGQPPTPAQNPFASPPAASANPFGQPPAPTQNPYAQTPPPASPPPSNPPRTSLSGEPIDDDDTPKN